MICLSRCNNVIKRIELGLCPGLSVRKISYDLNLINKLRGKLMGFSAYFSCIIYAKNCKGVINI